MEARFAQMEAALQQTIAALQASEARSLASEARVIALETTAAAHVPAAPPAQPNGAGRPAGASLVDMRVLGKPSSFSGDRESWKSWSFTMKAFAAALSPELRHLMDSASATQTSIVNIALSTDEQKWSRQLYYMLSLTTSGEALRRLQNVEEGEGAEGWRVFSEHYEPKTAVRYLGMLREILNFDFGDMEKVIDRIEQFRSRIRKYEEQSGEKVTENVRQAAFHDALFSIMCMGAGIQDSVVRDHLALLSWVNFGST